MDPWKRLAPLISVGYFGVGLGNPRVILVEKHDQNMTLRHGNVEVNA